MKKAFLIVPAIVILVLIGLFLFNGNEEKPIPLVDNLCFGMSPEQVSDVLGERIPPTPLDVAITELNAYEYRAEVLGTEASIFCYFWKDRYLTQVYILWETDSDIIFDEAYRILYEHFSQEEDFFEHTDDPARGEKERLSIGVDDGATGQFFKIIRTEDSVMVLGTDLE